MKRSRIFAGLFLIFLLCPLSQAAVPKLINFQGILKDGSGNLVADGSYPVIFTIYDSPTAGTTFWAETTSVTTSNGLFSVFLGSLNPVPDSAFNDTARYLGVKVGVDPEMTPRQKFASVGYTFRTEQWTTAAQNLFRLNGNVGIGTNSPNEKLTIAGSMEIGTGSADYQHLRIGGGNSSGFLYGSYPHFGDGIHMGYNYYADGTGTNQILRPDGGTSRVTMSYGSVALATAPPFGGEPVDRLFVSSSGEVGIGTANPGAVLQVHTTGLDQQLYVSSGAPSVTLGNNVDRSSATMRSAFVLATENGHYGLNAGDALLYNLGDARGDIYINSNYSGAGTKNVILQPSGGEVAIGTVTVPTYAKLYVEGEPTGAGGAIVGHTPRINSTGIQGLAHNGTGAIGVYGSSGSGKAGYFSGSVEVTGNLTKGGGAFKIDHPTDPAIKCLYHSFVESPDMKNIYDGVAVTDAKGNAIVTLPDWFGALNKDFRYQLTVIGQFAQAIISKKIENNRFFIQTDKPKVEVSWQVTGIRQDAYANAHRIPVEEIKSDKERGYYLHPDLFGQPEEKGVEWARHPEMMKAMKERRLEAEKDQK